VAEALAQEEGAAEAAPLLLGVAEEAEGLAPARGVAEEAEGSVPAPVAAEVEGSAPGVGASERAVLAAQGGIWLAGT
jgi:hypothetical protein